MELTPNQYKKHKLSPYLLVLLSFVLIILIGSFLLCIPAANKSGSWGDYSNALFEATSATCVTGLDAYKDGMGGTYTLFGQIVMAILIQIGGLGFITILAFFITLFQRNLSFKNRVFLSKAVNSDTIALVGKYVRKLLLATLIIELIGFGLGIPVFLTVYDNIGEVCWASLFMSISAFNNAGFDIFGNCSLIRAEGTIFAQMPDWAYYYMLTYLMILIIMGGISFLTIMDVFSFKKKPKQWRVYTKICLAMTGILIVVGFLLLLLTDAIPGVKSGYTISPMDAIFTSISARTAGFATFSMNTLSVGGRIVTCCLMVIGGCPLGTAGGIKTTTIFIIIVTIICYIRGKKAHAFNRYFSKNMFIKATFVTMISLILLLLGYFSLAMFESSNPCYSSENTVLEAVSAFTNTGFTSGMSTFLSLGGQITCIILMFIGRLGPITFFQLISNNMNKEESDKYHYVEEEIIIG